MFLPYPKVELLQTLEPPGQLTYHSSTPVNDAVQLKSGLENTCLPTGSSEAWCHSPEAEGVHSQWGTVDAYYSRASRSFQEASVFFRIEA